MRLKQRARQGFNFVSLRSNPLESFLPPEGLYVPEARRSRL
jgi:hypothetical protein